ncbi:MAG: ATPase, T2SS/T4P/T4SS family [Eggerthellaceae bacterium]
MPSGVRGRFWAGLQREQQRLTDGLIDMVFGFGPLESLLADDSVTEIMVNGPSDVFFERDGRLHRSEQRFADEGQLRALIDRVLGPLGRRIDEASPMVNARLPEGHRVHVIIPACAGRAGDDRAQVREAGHDVGRHGGHGVVRRGDADVSGGACALARHRGVGHGKRQTTLLNALSCELPPSERIITIEDSAELRFLEHAHVVRLEARPRNAEGTGEVSIRDLVANALRMRPDRIVVGECRGPEALDMLQAMNTGHDGSLTTLHANSPADAVARLATMVRYAVDLPVDVIEANVASSFDVVVQTARALDGSRFVSEVAELVYDGGSAAAGCARCSCGGWLSVWDAGWPFRLDRRGGGHRRCREEVGDGSASCGGVGVLAAFGCGAAASASVAGRAQHRTASWLAGASDRRASQLLRNGVGWTRPVTRALLGNRARGAHARAVGVVDARGLMTTRNRSCQYGLRRWLGQGCARAQRAGSVVCGIAVAVCACACAVVAAHGAGQAPRRPARGTPSPALQPVLPGRLVAAANVPAGGKRVQARWARCSPARPPAGNRGAGRALEVLRRGSSVAELAFVAVALDVQHQAGGSMKQVLDAARDTVQARSSCDARCACKRAAKLSARGERPALRADSGVLAGGRFGPFFPARWAWRCWRCAGHAGRRHRGGAPHAGRKLG